MKSEITVDTAIDWLLSAWEHGGATRGLLMAGVILVLGFPAAALAQRLSVGITRRTLAIVARWNRREPESTDTTGLAQGVGRTVYWFVVVLAVMAATESARLPVVTTWLSRVASFLPRFAVAIVVIALGSIVARLTLHVVTGTATSAKLPGAARLGRLAQIALLVATWLVAVEQIGIEISFLKSALLIVLGALLGGAALAFGLGSGRVVRDILAGHFLQKVYQVGQVLRVDDTEGRILRFTDTAVIVDGPDGEVVIPARHLAERRATIVTRPRQGR